MPVGNGAAEVAAELEKVRDKLPELFALENSFFNLVNDRTKRDKVSYRPERIPFQVSNGVKWRGGQLLDGQDLGRGGGPQLVFGALAPVEFDWIIEWTKHAEIATDSREKSVADYARLILKAHMKAAQNDLDSAIIFGDGANTIGIATVNVNSGTPGTPAPVYTAGTPALLYVDNARRFRQGADYDYYNGGPGTTITGTLTVSGIDYGNNALYIPTSLATAPTAGAYLIANNSAGVIGSGINGIQTLNQTTAGGTFMGVSKTANPGSFQTSAVNAQGATLTPQLARLLLNTLIINAGVDEVDKPNYRFLTGLGQKTAWENTAIAQAQVIQPGDATAHDMLPGTQITTIGGIKLIASPKYIPGRIDLIDLSTWFVSEVQELDYYSVGAAEMFPVYGASGGIASAMLKYLIWVGNIGCDNPKRNAVLYNLAPVTGFSF